MTKLAAKIQTRLQVERGATAVEYGVMVALIIAVVIGVVATIGTDILNAFTKVDTQLP